MNVEIVDLLLQCAKANEKVMLFNTYKGIPITFEAEFLKINRGVVALKVHKYQALCIQYSKHTLIKHDIFPHPILAQLKNVDFINKTVSLYEFSYADDRAGNRRSVRVAPDKSFPIVISSGIVVNAEAIDLSEEGCGVYIKSMYFDPKVFEPQKNITLEYRYPLEKRIIIRNQGVITHVLPLVNQNLHRLGIHTFADEDVRKAIHQYIQKRKVEIITELETYYQLLMARLSPTLAASSLQEANQRNKGEL